MDLTIIWAFLIAFAVAMYVVMDGFDLGIGILFPLVADDEDRDVMMNTVAPVWDGNETWLVLGGAGLLAAFPLAYSVVLSAFYLPLILMLIGGGSAGAGFVPIDTSRTVSRSALIVPDDFENRVRTDLTGLAGELDDLVTTS